MNTHYVILKTGHVIRIRADIRKESGEAMYYTLQDGKFVAAIVMAEIVSYGLCDHVEIMLPSLDGRASDRP